MVSRVFTIALLLLAGGEVAFDILTVVRGGAADVAADDMRIRGSSLGAPRGMPGCGDACVSAGGAMRQASVTVGGVTH